MAGGELRLGTIATNTLTLKDPKAILPDQNKRLPLVRGENSGFGGKVWILATGVDD